MKKLPLLLTGALMGILTMALIRVPASGQQDTIPTELISRVRILQGFAIAPVKLDVSGKSLAMVGLGSYLVNASGGCNDCHTHPSFAAGGDPFMGQKAVVNARQYLSGGTQFGPFTSRNLTPDPAKDNAPAGLTLEEFTAVMRTGFDGKMKHPQMGPLLQVMPWPAYTNMTDNDLQSIYEYLRAIPTLPDNPNPGPSASPVDPMSAAR